MIVDLRSDTVTKPTPGMLEAMWSANVGDDVFGEDETVNALEEKAAKIFGMEAGLFCPSGTMTNQIAIKCFTQPLDELIADQTSHVYRYEGGGIAFNSAVSTRLLNGDRGKITAEMIAPEINAENIHYPHTSLVVLENTVNKGGGSCYTLEDIKPIAELCRNKDLKLHLDGLGAPVGSVLLADKATIKYARRLRKVFGGGMRQAGFLAAAGIYALDHHVERLKIDHAHAGILAEQLAQCSWVKNVLPADTNIVLFDTVEPADAVLKKLSDQGIKANATDTYRIRFVTHLDVHPDQVEYVVKVLSSEL
jgi:threonine aldolase